MSGKFYSSELPTLILFAKAPEPGKVKTRLMPHCTASQAASVAVWLLDETLNLVCGTWQGRVVVSIAGDTSNEQLLVITYKHGVEIVQQPEGDLGQRMQASIEQFGYPSAVMGCDAPHCLPATLSQAQNLLQQGQSVIAPSEDGGYYLIGLTQEMDNLFESIPWGTNQVYALTQQAAYKHGYQFAELKVLRDIDRWDDLCDLVKQKPEFKSSLQEFGLEFDF